MEGLSVILRRFLLAAFVGAACALSVYKLKGDWEHFALCPNRDVLSWDANLRMIYALDARDDAKSGHAWRAVVAGLRSPTWPPLHGWIATAAYVFTEPSTVVEAGIGFVFFVLLCISLIALGPICARFFSLPAWMGAAAALFTLVCLFHSKEITAYSLSAMLETQGMVFFLVFCGALLLADRDTRRVHFLLLAASTGLFLTKFPYGHILVMALVPAAILHEREHVRRLLEYVTRTYRGKALILPGVLLLIVTFLAVARFLPGTPPNIKFFKYTFYAVVLLLFVDFNVRLYINRLSLEWVPALWRNLYLWTALPILVLTLLEPDRFSSTVGTQLHQQDAARSFVWSIIVDFLDRPAPILALGVLGVAAVAVLVIRRSKANGSMVILTILFHLLILELLTSNKQMRHIYHIMPAMLLFTVLAALPAFVGFARSFLLSGVLASACYLLAAQGSVFRAEHRAVRYVCWTGPSRAMFEPVRALVAQVPPSTSHLKALIVNDYHLPNAPMPGRVWATDVDLLLRFRLAFAARNDSRHEWKSWSEFDRLLHIAPGCEPLQPLGERARLMQVRMEKTGEYRADGELCITDYRLSRTGETQ